jgi:hypothetical protein
VIAFDSLNPYDTLGVILADSPQELVEKIRQVRTPIKIHFIVPFGARQAAYYTGDTNAQKVTSDVSTSITQRPRISKVR